MYIHVKYMSITTVNIGTEYLPRLGVIAEYFKRSKTQQLHQFIEDAEKLIQESQK